jgi:hypothetical protein
MARRCCCVMRAKLPLGAVATRPWLARITAVAMRAYVDENESVLERIEALRTGKQASPREGAGLIAGRVRSRVVVLP